MTLAPAARAGSTKNAVLSNDWYLTRTKYLDMLHVIDYAKYDYRG